MTKKTVRFRDMKPKEAEFVYRPPASGKPPITQNATIGVKFAQREVIVDDWHLIAGTRWSRALFRLKHPIVYCKRGLRNLYRRIKRIFFKPRMIQPVIRSPDISEEYLGLTEMMKSCERPNKHD